MVMDPAEETAVLQSARRACEVVAPYPPTSESARTADSARIWWEIFTSELAGPICEQWFQIGFECTLRIFPRFRSLREEFFNEAHLYVISTLSERLLAVGDLNPDRVPGFADWLRRLFFCSCQNLARRLARKAKRETVDADADFASVPDMRSDDWGAHADDRRAAIRDCVNRLPAENRIVMSLRVEDPDVTYRQMASRLGNMSTGTVSTRYHAALTLLRVCLERKGFG